MFTPGGVRVYQPSEAIDVIRALWTRWPATFEGKHYRVSGAYCDPRPDTPIPIMVGTKETKALGVVARLAYWGTQTRPGNRRAATRWYRT